jgi:cobyrinic acid a,c-diamide synthase
MKGFVVAGTGTGVGKTTVTAALLAAFRSRGLAVQPFKCGPDYIDPAHHAAIAGRPSYNLDTWMMTAEANRAIFREACRQADVAVVEGVMGLFDGASGDSEEGSTAEIAKLLGLPVVLIVDASNAARSLGAAVRGFRDFDPKVRLLGIILNGPAGPAHVKLLHDAVASVGVPVLGWLPRLQEAELRERHLGLITACESTWSREQLTLLAEAARRHIDLDLLLENCDIDGRYSDGHATSGRAADEFERARIGIAQDQAFCFYYQSSLDALRAAGAELVPFSPINDGALPSGLDGLYLGGGYPEVFAEQLAANRAMLQSVRQFADSGRPIYAECGGLMYLGEQLQTRDGQRYPMAAVLPLSVEMLDRLERFGYIEVELLDDCLVGCRGARLRGHSFHYSRVVGAGNLACRYRTQQVLTGSEQREGYCAGNVLASYIHLSFAGNPAAASRLVQVCLHSRAVVR